jgi:hypothetical protein
MCPACLTTAALIVGGVASAGGLAVVAIKKFGARGAADEHPPGGAPPAPPRRGASGPPCRIVSGPPLLSENQQSARQSTNGDRPPGPDVFHREGVQLPARAEVARADGRERTPWHASWSTGEPGAAPARAVRRSRRAIT